MGFEHCNRCYFSAEITRKAFHMLYPRPGEKWSTLPITMQLKNYWLMPVVLRGSGYTEG
jgi:hypothetical protein